MREWLTSEHPSPWVERVYSGLHRSALPLLKLLSRSPFPRCAPARRAARSANLTASSRSLHPERYSRCFAMRVSSV